MDIYQVKQNLIENNYGDVLRMMRIEAKPSKMGDETRNRLDILGT
jgi:hypothetical protein